MGKPIDCDECGGWGRLYYDTRDGDRSSKCEDCDGSGLSADQTRPSVRDTMPCAAPAFEVAS